MSAEKKQYAERRTKEILEQLETLKRELAPLQKEVARLHTQMQPLQEQIRVLKAEKNLLERFGDYKLCTKCNTNRRARDFVSTDCKYCIPENKEANLEPI